MNSSNSFNKHRSIKSIAVKLLLGLAVVGYTVCEGKQQTIDQKEYTKHLQHMHKKGTFTDPDFQVKTQQKFQTLADDDGGSSTSTSTKRNIKDFHPRLFWNRPSQNFYPVNTGIPEFKQYTDQKGNIIKGGQRIMAVGDLNNDKSVDIVTVNDDATHIQVHNYDSKNMQWMESVHYHMKECLGNKVERIISINISLAMKNNQDLYVIYKSKNQEQKAPKLCVLQTKCQKGQLCTINVNNEHILNDSELPANIQPFFLDINGDMNNDIMMWEDKLGSEPGLYIEKAEDSEGESFKRMNFYEHFVVPNKEDKDCQQPDEKDTISSPHSNSYVDFNGDCMPDLFLQKQKKTLKTETVDGQTRTLYEYDNYYEIYVQKIHNKKAKFCLKETGHIVETKQRLHPNEDIPLIEFNDYDLDGMIDMAFFHDGKVYTFYNMHKTLTIPDTSLAAADLCKSEDQVAEDSQNRFFMKYDTLKEEERPLADNSQNKDDKVGGQGNEWITILDLKFLGDGNHISKEGIVNPSLNTNGKNEFPFPGRISFSDLNIDGYPDLLISLWIEQRGTNIKYKNSFVLISTPCRNEETGQCDLDQCGEKACRFAPDKNQPNVFKQRRTFRNIAIDEYNFPYITELADTDASQLIPFDIDEDGRMDILVQIQKVNEQTGEIQNSLELIYNNQIFDAFYIKSEMISVKGSNPEDGSSATVGASFRYLVTSLEDEKRVQVASQLPNQSYNNLVLPYIYQGLGRSNNYVESYNVGYSMLDRLDQVKVWTPIIPNSQLIVWANNGNKEKWRLDSFTQLTKIVPLIVAGAVFFLIVNGIIVIYLHVKEKREDDKSRVKLIF